MESPCILVKTPLGMENIVAARINEELPWTHVEPSPRGFKGLVLVYRCKSRDDMEIVSRRIVEADKILWIEATVKADPKAIGVEAAKVAVRHITPGECFAIRTTRRGKHSFTSIDVNVVAGKYVKDSTGACVNLNYPDKVIAVEIIGGEAHISVYPGALEWRKMRPGKNPVYTLFRRISVVQMPYLGPLDACRNMGVRIGREIQNFEVRELVVAPIGLIDAVQLLEFLKGVIEGIESRYEVQRRSYYRKPWRVPVYLQDLHQLVRDRYREPIVVMEPEGEHVSKVADELWRLVQSSKRVNVLVGSREGIPPGVYRHASLVVDVAPGVTISTDYAAASALIAMATVLHDKLGGLELEDTGSTGGR